MLYYIKIDPFKGIDYSDRQDYAGNTRLKPIQCGSCLFHFYHNLNFQYERYICSGCYHCMQYEKASNGKMPFRVINTKKGNFRTVSSYFLVEIEELLEKRDLKHRFGWLYKDESMVANKVKVESSYGIEPLSLK